jgi:hypothetical protein
MSDLQMYIQTTGNLPVLHVFSFQVESVLTSLVPGYATAEPNRKPKMNNENKDGILTVMKEMQ